MALTAESGKDGFVAVSGTTHVAEVTKWTLHKQIVVTQFGSSEGAGYKKAISGVRSCSGTIEGKWDASAVSGLIDGTSTATLLLYLNGTEKYTIPAIISDFTITVDIDNGTPTGFTAEFVNNGAWTEPTLS